MKNNLKDDVSIYIENIEVCQKKILQKLNFIDNLKKDVVFAIKNYNSNIFYDIKHLNHILKIKDVSPYDVNYTIISNMNKYILDYLKIESDLDKLHHGHTYPLRSFSFEYIRINYDNKEIELSFKKDIDMCLHILETITKQLEDEQKNEQLYTSYETWRKQSLLRDKENFGYIFYLKNLSFTILHNKKCKELYEKCKKSHLSCIKNLSKIIQSQKDSIEKVKKSEELYLDKIKSFAKEFNYTLIETIYKD